MRNPESTLRLFHRAKAGQCLIVMGDSAQLLNSNWVGTVNRTLPWVDAVALEDGEVGDVIRVAMKQGLMYNITKELPQKIRTQNPTVGALGDVDPRNAMSLPKSNGVLWLGRDSYLKAEPEGIWAVIVGRYVDEHTFIFDPQIPFKKDLSSVAIERFVISADGIPGGSTSSNASIPYGTSLKNIVIDASFSEEPALVQITISNGPPISVSSFPFLLPQSILIESDWVPVTLTAVSADGKSTSKNITFSAQHMIFWGGGKSFDFNFEHEHFDRSRRIYTFTAKTDEDYGWFAAPAHWGFPQFWEVTGALQGGWFSLSQSVLYNNKIPYNIYRTDYYRLGTFSMDIKWDF